MPFVHISYDELWEYEITTGAEKSKEISAGYVKSNKRVTNLNRIIELELSRTYINFAESLKIKMNLMQLVC